MYEIRKIILVSSNTISHMNGTVYTVRKQVPWSISCVCKPHVSLPVRTELNFETRAADDAISLLLFAI